MQKSLGTAAPEGLTCAPDQKTVGKKTKNKFTHAGEGYTA